MLSCKSPSTPHCAPKSFLAADALRGIAPGALVLRICSHERHTSIHTSRSATVWPKPTGLWEAKVTERRRRRDATVTVDRLWVGVTPHTPQCAAYSIPRGKHVTTTQNLRCGRRARVVIHSPNEAARTTTPRVTMHSLVCSEKATNLSHLSHSFASRCKLTSAPLTREPTRIEDR